MVSEKEINVFLAFFQIVPIVLIWIRLESRMSKMEGRFDMFLLMIQKTLDSIEKRR